MEAKYQAIEEIFEQNGHRSESIFKITIGSDYIVVITLGPLTDVQTKKLTQNIAEKTGIHKVIVI